MNLGHKGKHHT